jgi:hypothetical protein
MRIIGTSTVAAAIALASALAIAVNASASHPRPDGGSPFRVGLVPAFKQCTAPDATHTSPLALPSCAGAQRPALESPILTTSSIGSGLASMRYEVFCSGGAAGEMPPCSITPGDQEDIRVTLSITDVRCAVAVPGCSAPGADYSGQLIVQAIHRLTDHANPNVCSDPSGAPPCVNGTMTDLSYSLAAACTPTASPSRGSDCKFDTTIDSLVPQQVKEQQRQVAEMFSTDVLDAGPDGQLSPPGAPLPCPPICGTGDESRYLRQGLFTP